MSRNKSKKKKDFNEKKESKRGGKRMRKEVMIQSIVSAFQSSPKESFNYKQISKMIGIENHVQKLQVVDILYDLADDHFITETDRGRYRLHDLGTIAIGTFTRRSNGKNSFVPEDGGSPVFIAERNSNRAMDGDKVKIQLFAKRKGAEPEGEVVEILESKERTYVGKLQVTKGFAFLVTEDKTLANDIFIPKDKLKGGKNGDKAIVKIMEWPEGAKNPLGEVVDILGQAGNNTTEMHAILAEFGLPYKYPIAVEKAAEKIPDEISSEEIAQREDFRQVLTFTIDPKDAKDFDDALSARRLENGNWEIGVHIADVTYYVKPESIIEREAQSRATSVYLVDRTIPMLPERLSNGICSLRPNEEKLCFAVIFEMDETGIVKKSRICRTVIKSDRRFTYEEAQQIIETGEGDCKEAVLALNELAQKLRIARFDKGAINFDRYEVKFEIDENGKPLSVYFKEAKEANKLIEEFMLLANRTVAEFIGNPEKGKSKKTFVYRIHEQPDPEKLENFATFIRRFGYKLKVEGSQESISKGINKLLDKAQGSPEENLVETLAIRSMKKARYSTENVGHYGLAFEYYSHFTSPIRRYPDMMVHRLLERYLAGGRSAQKEKFEELCDHSSTMEQVAANAERASVKYKQVEFMSDKLGMIFDGVISGVTEWGLYVELNENKCEGLVPMRDLDDDFYEFDEKNYCLMGRRTKREYRLGDPITIKVVQANLERKQLDFMLAD
ncbi:ribonuclease R [Parabacteroides sp. PF5-9]|uniref:ribonuclease R n=1 Tax=Parabacteroides sp. PF5-9 TaxID=1742404 RepID=UPI0024747F72|nr:ribonuclease R [Parabacteroides sp. PF5-9]MDH6356194.1 ribonuclease R [Parabacteroides sp. PF5-9]